MVTELGARPFVGMSKRNAALNNKVARASG
jgi:hypothetical protein